MRRFVLVTASLIILLGVHAGVAQPPGLAAVLNITPNVVIGGELAVQKCSGCHNLTGRSFSPDFPRIGGQVRSYLLTQLWRFREGGRVNGNMSGLAALLSDQDIADVSAFLANQTPDGPAWRNQVPALVELGAALYELGNHDNGVIACAICHGANGEGVEQLGIPRVVGQSPDYLSKALVGFINTPDIGVPGVSAMTINASRLTEEEIEALVVYMSSLPWGDP